MNCVDHEKSYLIMLIYEIFMRKIKSVNQNNSKKLSFGEIFQKYKS